MFTLFQPGLKAREVEFSMLNMRQNMWAWSVSSEHKTWLAERGALGGGLFDCACQEDKQPGQPGTSSDEDSWVTPPSSSTPDPPSRGEADHPMMSSRSVSNLFSGFLQEDPEDEPKGKTCVICLRKGHKTKECNMPCAWLSGDGAMCGGRAWEQHREECQFRSMYNDDRSF